MLWLSRLPLTHPTVPIATAIIVLATIAEGDDSTRPDVNNDDDVIDTRDVDQHLDNDALLRHNNNEDDEEEEEEEHDDDRRRKRERDHDSDSWQSDRDGQRGRGMKERWWAIVIVSYLHWQETANTDTIIIYSCDLST